MSDRESSPEPSSGKTGGALLLTWLATVLGVPSAVAALKWRAIEAYPVLGFVLLFVAATLAGAGGLARELWRRKYDDRIVDWISAGLDRGISRFGRQYRAHLLAELRYVDLKGLAARFYTPELDEVYVDVAVRPRDPGAVPSSDLTIDASGLPETGQRRLLLDFLGQPQPRVLAVIGAPGSGKTTMLRHTARDVCLRRRGQRRRIPVLLYLRDHARVIVADPEIALSMLVSTVLARYGLVEPAGWLDGRLRAGDCVVLLDGLDEVARKEDRAAISEWVSVQVLRNPGNDFVVTSRPLGYQSAPIENAITLQTQPFTDEQVRRFVYAWYLAVERQSTGAVSPDITRRAYDEADDLLARLRESPALRDLAVNPLLLTMIATVHRHHGALPGSRAELYAQICQVLLWRRQEAKKLAVEPRGPQKERVMRLLAFEMMRRQVRDLSTAEATAVIRPALRRIGKNPTATAAEFLDDAASNGLFIERENGVRAFAHLTFQEYLAAAHIKDKNLQDVLAQAASAGDSWWRETTLLYAAGADAGSIVQACLAADTVPALALAFDCAEEAGELAEDLRSQLDIQAAELSRDADPQRRRLMAGVTITRQLRRIIYGDNGARICSQIVTARTYQYFLGDMAARGQNRPPDTPPSTGDEAATGMRGSDAEEFVHWVSDITGQPTYRLPTLAEIRDPAIRMALTGQLDLRTHGIWLAASEPGIRPQLLPPLDVTYPWPITWTEVQHQARTGIRDLPLTWILLPLMSRICTTRIPPSGTPLTGILDHVRDLSRSNTHGDLTEFILLALDIARDIKGGTSPIRDRALVLVRDLALALGLARDLSVAVTHARDLARVGVRARDLNHMRARARDLDRALDRVLDQALDLDRDSLRVRALNLDPAIGRDIARVLELVRELGHDVTRVLDIVRGPVRDLTRVLDLVHNLPDGLDSVLDLGCALASALDDARSLDLDLVRALTLGDGFRTYLGHALSETIAAMASDPAVGQLSNFQVKDMLTDRLFAVSGVGVKVYAVTPDLIVESINNALSQAKTRLAVGDDSSARWVSLVIANFQTIAEDALTRKQLITTPLASACRVMALCLAAEAHYQSAPDVSDMFRQIAADITWLERRHSGADPSREVIVLALD